MLSPNTGIESLLIEFYFFKSFISDSNRDKKTKKLSNDSIKPNDRKIR